METRSMPSLRHLRVFLMVAELQSVRKAADAVFLSQPAVTQAIAKVEAQIGAVLFERRSSGTYLSEAGTILASRAASMFRQIHEALAGLGLTEDLVDSVSQRITRSQIRGLIAAAGGTSFAEAAEALHLSQVSLYRSARDLERTLGRTLFYNSVSGIVPAPAGMELACRLSTAMREVEWAMEEIRAAEGKQDGELRVGAMPLAGSFVLGPVIHELTRLCPGAHVNMRTGSCSALARALQIGEIDFVVGLIRNTVDPAEIEQEALFSSPYVIVGRPGHPLSKKAKITPADLEAFDWIAPSNGSVRRAALDRLLASMKRPPVANIEAYSISTIRLLMSESDRLTIMTKFEFECERAGGALAMLPYDRIEPAHTTGVAWRAGWTPTPLHLKFLKLLRAQGAKIASSDALVQAA
ncbi:MULTISPECIES: LysR family transcriptional regulator [unclassified Sinorhizobium]|uniref:LysR family transcriptional regulator n=1 Tax=unclassified Sinorhizobium TaxID=2613772 RepID=UPI003523E474